MPYDSPHFRLEPLAQGVYAALAKPDGLAWTNAGIVDLGGYTLVFDTFFNPAAGEDLRRAAEIVTGRTVNWVVNSSYSLLHVGGNQSFHNATILSTPLARQLMTDKLCTLMQVWRKNPTPLLEEVRRDDYPFSDEERSSLDRNLLDMLPGLHITVPEQTFSGPMELHGTLRSVELRPLEDDPAGRCILTLEAEGILFCGGARLPEQRALRVIPGRGF